MKAKIWCALLVFCMLALCSCNVPQSNSIEIGLDVSSSFEENSSKDDVPILNKKSSYTTADCEWLLENSIENLATMFGVNLANEPSGELLLEGRTLLAPFMYLNDKLVLLTPYTIESKEIPTGIIVYGEKKEPTPMKDFYFFMEISEIDTETYTICDSFIKVSEGGLEKKAKVVEVPTDKVAYRCVFLQDGDKFLLNYVEARLIADNTSADPMELFKNMKLDSFDYFVTSAGVMDINGDHLPEIILNCGDGWEYHVYYYSNGAIQQIGDLSAWTWSSSLWTSAAGDLILCAEAHTTGTAGFLQYRIYRWNEEQYILDIDLCRIPTKWDAEGIPVSHNYFSSNTCIDLSETTSDELADRYNTITQEEFDAKIASFGALTLLQLPVQTYQLEDSNSLNEYLQEKLDAWTLP